MDIHTVTRSENDDDDDDDYNALFKYNKLAIISTLYMNVLNNKYQ
jgi:hypothetical protein